MANSLYKIAVLAGMGLAGAAGYELGNSNTVPQGQYKTEVSELKQDNKNLERLLKTQLQNHPSNPLDQSYDERDFFRIARKYKDYETTPLEELESAWLNLRGLDEKTTKLKRNLVCLAYSGKEDDVLKRNSQLFDYSTTEENRKEIGDFYEKLTPEQRKEFLKINPLRNQSSPNERDIVLAYLLTIIDQTEAEKNKPISELSNEYKE